MTFKQRIGLYSTIEKMRGFPLIAYVTRNGQFNNGQMSLDVIPEICKQIDLIPKNEKEIDILIVSQGGDPVAAWRIMNLLRERFDRVNVLVPFSALSAATVLTLGADTIIMHPYSCLGPIDPQIIVPGSSPNDPYAHKAFSVEDITSYVEFIRDEINLTDGKSMGDALDYLVEELDPTVIGLVKKSMKFSESVSKKLLLLHLDDQTKIDTIVERFNNMTHHGYTVSRKEAKDLGLPVVFPNDDLENAIWALWLDFEDEMKFRTVFDPKAILRDDTATMSKLNHSLQNNNHFQDALVDTTSIAVLESKCLSCHFDNIADIVVSSDGINTQFNVNISPCGWKRSDPPRE